MTSKRIAAVDLSRGVACIVMISLHALFYFGDKTAYEHSFLSSALIFLGHGTSAFLMLLGFCFAISKRASFSHAVKRGLMIFCAAYILNFFRFIVPIEFFGTANIEWLKAYGFTAPLTFSELMFFMKIGDIFQCVGLSFILVGAIHHFFKSKYVIMLFFLVIVCLSSVIRDSGIKNMVLDSHILDHLFDLFFGAKFVYFPVFPWVSNIILGIYFGMYFLEHDGSYHKTYMHILLIGVLFSIIGSSLYFYNKQYHFGDFYNIGPGGTLMIAGLLMVAMVIFGKLTDRFMSEESMIFKVLQYLSQRIIWIYIIHFLVIFWIMNLFNYKSYGPAGIFFLAIFFLIATIIVDYSLKTVLASIRHLKDFKNTAK